MVGEPSSRSRAVIALETTPMIVARESSSMRFERLPDGILAGQEIRASVSLMTATGARPAASSPV